MAMYRYQVVWGSEATEVTAATPFEALKIAADRFRVNWKYVAEEMIVTPLREIKAHRGVFS